ncbi:MAG: serine/threonine protein kinase [Gammaproteobacteria bacterium]
MTLTIQVPGYKLHKLLGEGGMASVYLATQESLDRPVALKILKKFDTETQAQRFFNEGRIIASLNQRNIITIHDLGEVNGRCFLAMEYLEGGDLKQRIAAGMTADDALKLLKLIAQALDFVHQKDIVHRDIKPENILFRKDGSPVLTDFGVAKQLQSDSSLTMDGLTVGSPHYLSPEQAEQKKLDARTDIYSLGIIFYEMLTGEKPFQGDSPIEIIIAHLTTEAQPLPKSLLHYQALLDLMIAKDANDRLDSASALLAYLDRLQSATPAHRLTDTFTKLSFTKEKLDNKTENRLSPAQPAGSINKALISGLLVAVASSIAVYFFSGHKPVFTTDSVSEPIASPALEQKEMRSANDKNESGDWSAKAERILAQPNLSRQALEEAYQNYKQVLKQAPENERALQGIMRIASRVIAIQQQIDLYLVEADRALNESRLTSPADNNALSYYEKVLALDAENDEALQGKLRVANAYADLVESSLNDFEYDKAKTSLDKGLSIDPTSPRLLALKAKTSVFKDAPKPLFVKFKSIFD